MTHRAATYILLILFLLISGGVQSSTKDEIKKRQAELQSIRDQIRQFEEKIERQQKNEQSTLELLDTYDRKATLVRRLIARLRNEEKEMQDSVEVTRTEIKHLGSQLEFLKKHYANYVASAYKAGQLHDIELLLASRSINQFYIRAEYLRRFSDQRKSDIGRIRTKKDEIEEKQAQLQEQLSEERRLIAEKGAEEDRLAALVADRRQVLQQIRKDKKIAQRELDRRLASVKELERLIADLIEQDRIKKEREHQRTGKLPQPPGMAGSFETKRGKLRWPVSEGAVVARFGNQRHPTLKTITQNTGIDIAVTTGTSVTAVADGEVATIWWLPSYGNIIIVDHYSGYRTVYSHLAEIRVTQGQKVKEGESIGTSGESLDGARLHFELWKDREKQNPELWLSPQ
ncbi:MAG: Peptidase protein [Bacteroidetes bacterium]|nr:Peptidase protein [Bacteroidota bacterium]